MLKLKYSFFFLYLIGMQAFCQNEEYFGKNIVKFNLTSLASRAYQMGAERVLFKPVSIAAWYTFSPMGKATSIYSTKYVLDIDELDILISESIVGFDAFTGEIRIYPGKGYARGFYFSPFYQTGKYRFENFPFKYESDNGTTEQLEDGKGAIYRDDFGLLLGMQFSIGRHFVLDAFVGPKFSSATGHFTGLAPDPLTNNEQSSLFSNIEYAFQGGTDLVTDIGKIVTSSTGAHVEIYPDNWIDFRAGLNIGFRF